MFSNIPYVYTNGTNVQEMQTIIKSSFFDEALIIINVLVSEQLVWIVVSAELIGSKMAVKWPQS